MGAQAFVLAFGHGLVLLGVMVIGGLCGALCWRVFSNRGQKMTATPSVPTAIPQPSAITEEMVKQKLAQIDLNLSSGTQTRRI